MADQAIVNVEVVHGNALEVDADVLALKYARKFHGVDLEVASRLQPYVPVSDMSPPIGGFRVLPTHGTITASHVFSWELCVSITSATAKNESSVYRYWDILLRRPRLHRSLR